MGDRTNIPGAVRALAGSLALAAIYVYQGSVSVLFPPCCRFYPSCSSYAREAIRRHGLNRGGRLALRRLLRCGPWGPHGIDPVP